MSEVADEEAHGEREEILDQLKALREEVAALKRD